MFFKVSDTFTQLLVTTRDSFKSMETIVEKFFTGINLTIVNKVRRFIFVPFAYPDCTVHLLVSNEKSTPLLPTYFPYGIASFFTRYFRKKLLQFCQYFSIISSSSEEVTMPECT